MNFYEYNDDEDGDQTLEMRQKLGEILKTHYKYYVLEKEKKSTPRLIDKLIGFSIEDSLDPNVPTFLTHHPICMSPLAKSIDEEEGRNVSARFELFAGGMEICNGYSELNDPVEQRKRFAKQMKLKEVGDDEAQMLDESFCKSLALGLPPTGGLGVGIDRIVMLLLKQKSIRDVLFFPYVE